ncbi:MAG: dienelactone hydrolase [Gammaproteobacteria bacterium]|nr:dienelactone hydrolase [Gammaproteobacteria bacterium]
MGIRVIGLVPESDIRIVAERPQAYGWNRLYRSAATFRADEEGVVDLSVDAPVSGSWTVADPNGLFWSMRNTGDEIPQGWERNEVRIRVLDAQEAMLDSEALTWRASLDELVETPLGNEFPGAFVLRKPGDDPLPAIVILGGSEGGDMAARMAAPLWAERGYVAVGYPYYSPSWPSGTPEFPELPEGFVNLRLDKLADVRDVLRGRADIDGDRIGLMGTSKGAEFVLAAASRIDGFPAVAAIVPSDVIWEGWGAGHVQGEKPGFSWRGEPLPFVPYVDISRGLGPEAEVPLSVPHAEGREAHPDRVEAARIRVEDIDEPVFLLGGGRDRTWPSGEMAIRIAAARTAAGLETEALVFATGGHGLGGPPQLPTRTASVPARTAGWRALNAFFERTLKDIDPD